MPMKNLYAHVHLSESEVNQIISALDAYSYGFDQPFKKDFIEIRRKLHTALTIAKLNQIDEDE